MSERRKFSRIDFNGECSLIETIDGKQQQWQSELLDVSLKGALVKLPIQFQYAPNKAIQINLNLQGSDIVLEINGEICHEENELIGIKFLTLSLESISHLKRLIELNIADESLMHREISQLINPS